MQVKNTLSKLVDPYAAQLQTSKRISGKEAQGTNQPTNTRMGDRVNVSLEAKLLQEAHTTAINAPEIRQERVNALKAQVEAGTYKPDSKQIAAKLLQSETQLFTAIRK